MRQFHLFYEVYAVMEKTDREGADKREGRLRQQIRDLNEEIAYKEKKILEDVEHQEFEDADKKRKQLRELQEDLEDKQQRLGTVSNLANEEKKRQSKSIIEMLDSTLNVIQARVNHVAKFK